MNMHGPGEAGLAVTIRLASSSSPRDTSIVVGMSHISGRIREHMMPTSSLPVQRHHGDVKPHERGKSRPSGTSPHLAPRKSRALGARARWLSQGCAGFAAVSMCAGYTLMAIQTPGRRELRQSCSRGRTDRRTMLLGNGIRSALDLRPLALDLYVRIQFGEHARNMVTAVAGRLLVHPTPGPSRPSDGGRESPRSATETGRSTPDTKTSRTCSP